MKYYVEVKVINSDRSYSKSIYGDICKRSKKGIFRSYSHYVRDNKCELQTYNLDSLNVENLYTHPLKTLRSANILKNKLIKKMAEDIVYKVRVVEYPDEISYDQFAAFIKW